MARIPRFVRLDTPTIYHLTSRTTLEGFPIIDEDKDQLLSIIFNLCKVYFVDILGFCVMGNHFHLIIRMNTDDTKASNKEIMKRYSKHFGEECEVDQQQVDAFRQRIGNLGLLLKDIKQNFTRHFNKRSNKRGFFWGDRFKSVIVEEGFPLINSLAYIDLNPVRARLVGKPEEYKWNTLGYLTQNGSENNLIRTDLWMDDWKNLSQDGTVSKYKEFIYETGAMSIDLSSISDSELTKRKRVKGDPLVRAATFSRRCRYFTDSGVLGSHDFVKEMFERVKHSLGSKDTRRFSLVHGVCDLYSMRRLGKVNPPSHYNTTAQRHALK